MSDLRTGSEAFLQHYQRELDFLQREGEAFAAAHPARVGGQLKLADQQAPDPHVERLRQSFAFLTARVHAKLEDDYPELSDALLGLLYPQLASPVPSMAVVEAELDTQQSVPTAGKPVPHRTTFRSKPVDGEPLLFRSGGDAVLWPIRVERLRVDRPGRGEAVGGSAARAVLRLTLEAVGEHPFGALELDRLRLYFKGPSRVACELHEVLCTRLAGVRAQVGDHRFELPASNVRPVGFEPGAALLECPRRAFSGYRLLQEYLAFPARFLFVEIGGLERLRGADGRRVELSFLIQRELRVDAQEVDAENVSTGCIPLVNLFEKTADPITLDPRVGEFPVQPDRARPLSFEVHTVRDVVGVSTRGADRVAYAPFYSLRHATAGGAPDVYWHAHRRPTSRGGDDGTDVSLSFVDLDLRRTAPVDQVLHVRTLCTNRDLPSRAREWRQPDDFTAEGLTGVRSVRCVHAPTPARRLAGHGAGHWRLISHLSLNYLSLVREGRDALREILGTYAVGRSSSGRDQIDGIHDVASEPVLRWIRTGGGAGYCRGTHTTLVLDRRHFAAASPFCFAAVIERFLALYCSINSFSELSAETFETDPSERELVHAWEPRSGERSVL